MDGYCGASDSAIHSAICQIAQRFDPTPGLIRRSAKRPVARSCYSEPPSRHLAMTTTTIRLEADLKRRAAAAAQRAGKTVHAFLLDAIAQTVEQSELDEAFHHLADERWGKLLASGKTVAWDDAKQYLEARASGARARKPTARKTAR